MNRTKEMRELAEELGSRGWRISLNKHWRCAPPDRTRPVLFFSKSPSDHHALENAKAFIRKTYGLDL